MRQTDEEHLQKRIAELEAFLSTIDGQKERAAKQLEEYRERLEHFEQIEQNWKDEQRD